MHFWQVDDLYKIFSKKFDCDVILPKKFRHISKLKNNVITSSLRYFMYIRVILIAKNMTIFTYVALLNTQITLIILKIL